MADIQIKPSIGEVTPTEKQQSSNDDLVKLKETMFAGMRKLNDKIEALKIEITDSSNDLNLLLNSFHSKEIDKLTEAMSQVQGEIVCIGKDAKGHRNKYAPLPAIIMSIKNLCAHNKIGIFQDLIINPKTKDKYILTTISHSGQWMKSLWPIEVESSGNIDQAEGGAITFWKRYILQAMFNIPVAEEGDLDDFNNEVDEKTAATKTSFEKNKETHKDIINKKTGPGGF